MEPAGKIGNSAERKPDRGFHIVSITEGDNDISGQIFQGEKTSFR